MQYRWIYIGLGLFGVAAIAAGIAFNVEGEGPELPEPIESISPQPGELVPPQTGIEVDLAVGYAAVIYVDGWPISDEVLIVDATGVYTWSPSATSLVIPEWTAGEHTVKVVYDTYAGLPDTGEFEWAFRVG